MILQSIVFSNDIEIPQELFYRVSGDVICTGHDLLLCNGQKLTTDTYMNLFDYKTWRKYTEMEKCAVTVTYEGEGILAIYEWSTQGRKKINEYILSGEQESTEQFEISPIENECTIYLEISAKDKLNVMQAAYVTLNDEIDKRHIHISLLSCTYKRKKEILRNIQKIKKSRFYRSEDELFGKMDLCVIDNGSELEVAEEAYYKLVHNPNTGGSGGFTRGILEARKDANRYGTTHVIFMDDDVLFLEETFSRLYAFLSLVKEAYQDEVIAGRMFRLDQRNIQYTASEIWNKSQIIHRGYNLDMSDSEHLLNVNDRGGEYTGWWFGCFPMSFVQENLPLPFFLHCDDVEYGLRHGGEPIVLNGIQVWHETAEYRMTSTIAYYDMRNSMIVNTIYDLVTNCDEILISWKEKISEQHINKNFHTERMIIKGMMDYCKGPNYWLALNSTKKNNKLKRKKHVNRYINSFLWRITEIWIKKMFEVLRHQYEEDVKYNH